MTDLQLLFLILAVLYLWECACWIRRGSVAFITWLGQHWRALHPGLLLGNQRGGFVFAPPLPPLGTVFTGNQWPVSLSPDGVLAFVASSVNPGGRPAQSGKCFRWNAIRNVTVRGRKVLVDGEALVQAPSATFAEHLAQELRSLQKLPPERRASAIETVFCDSLDTRALQQRMTEFRQRTGKLRLTANFLFVYIFLLAPILIWHLGLRQCWLGLLVGLLVCTSTVAVLFSRAHKSFFPAADDERFTHFVIVLLAPASTIRAHDLLSRPLLEKFHPLALAQALLPEARFREMARDTLREIRYPALPLCPGEDPAAVRTEGYSRLVLQKTVEQFLKRNSLEPESLLRAPSPTEDTCRSYCPRCLAQFTTFEGACADCGGLALVPFTGAETQAAAKPGGRRG